MLSTDDLENALLEIVRTSESSEKLIENLP